MTAHPLRIVHCLRAPVGGAFRHVCDLIAAQRAEGHAVGLICDASTGDDFAEMRLDRLAGETSNSTLCAFPCATCPLLPISPQWHEPSQPARHAAGRAALTRRQGRHLCARARHATARLRVVKTRRFYSPHGGSLHYRRKTLSGRIYFGVESTLEHICDGLCFVSNYEAEQYAAKIHPPRIPHATVHNGLRPDELAPVTLGAEARDFLFIGEFRDLKGPDLFLLALTAIGEACGTTPTAHMVGSGEERMRYEEMAHDLGIGESETFHGPMPVREAFAMARNVIIPSRAESLPYIVL
ncbi:MAG: glycosyltransferase [Breoghania sp.]|nr:glycosyltransferase [Breoghania sp.]MDJ0932327.1 glycosyltransferase [Breoghania sp.]